MACSRRASKNARMSLGGSADKQRARHPPHQATNSASQPVPARQQEYGRRRVVPSQQHCECDRSHAPLGSTAPSLRMMEPPAATSTGAPTDEVLHSSNSTPLSLTTAITSGARSRARIARAVAHVATTEFFVAGGLDPALDSVQPGYCTEGTENS
eukprot:COSAG02_NODE_10483_length_1932_cov_1.232951_2_plen_155_part_00